jgi:methionyl-tRNA formyltransferase
MKKIKRILAIGHDNSGSRIIFEQLFRSFPGVKFSLVITEGLYYRKSFTGSVIKLLRESSLLFCAARAVDMVMHRVSGSTLDQFAVQQGIRPFHTSDINDANSFGYVRSQFPDLIVSMYTMHIYKRPILELPSYGAIAVHPSILPAYRGLEVFFWAMANNENQIGVSAFTIDPKIDYGEVMNDAIMPLEPNQSMQSVYKMITEKSAELLIKSISQLDNGVVTYRKPLGEGSYYGMPTREAVRRFRRLGKRFF